MKYIYVCNDRWHFVGYEEETKAGKIKVSEAYNIRRWGTTKGLGELALNGPTRSTELDVYGTIWIEKAKLLFRIAVVEAKWKK